jgi:poly-gamma-glutamate synthesis protein (capsule biosynthesis protein)
LPVLSPAAAADAVEQVRQLKRPGDVAVASVHWGSNWGFAVPHEQVRFAHRLIDGGVDLVHGHSSHHPRPVEVYRGKLVLYGCGDFVDDYEGIAGYEEYRPDLRLAHVATLDPGSGCLVELRMTPLRARRMRLERAPREDSAWLRETLARAGRHRGASLRTDSDGTLVLRPTPPHRSRARPA